ncbi:MAG TPA: hypothetical protein VIL46_09615, partial [Gemmataceae bacterium]
MSTMRSGPWIAVVLAGVWFSSAAGAAEPAPEEYRVGVAKADVTPRHPVRLNGFGFRRTESE